MKREDHLKSIILQRFGTIKEFSRAIDLPYTTIRSILERGISNAKLGNVITICNGLGISTESLITQEDFVMESSTVAYSSYLHTQIQNPSSTEKVELPDIVMGKYAGDKAVLFTKMVEETVNKIIPSGSYIGIKEEPLMKLTDGDIVIYTYQEKQSVKKLYKIGNSLVFKPVSHDPKFIDSVYEATDQRLRILGKIVVYIVIND